MVRLLLIAAIILSGEVAFAADELDQEQNYTNVQQRPVELPIALIVKVSEKGEVEVALANDELPPNENSLPSDLRFQKLAPGVTYKLNAAEKSFSPASASELDSDQSARESWYFHFNFGFNFAYPFYFYQPYHFHYQRPFFPVYYYPYFSFPHHRHHYHYYRHRRHCCW